MNILITGSSGLVGTHLVKEVLANGDVPVGYDLSVPVAELKDKFQFVVGDLLDLENIKKTILDYKIDRVIHTGAILVIESAQDPYQGTQVNIIGTANVLEAARLCGIKRVVVTSSISAYGITGTDTVNEEHPTAPLTYYGATKMSVEYLAQAYMAAYQMEIPALRLALIYGPGRARGFMVLEEMIVGAKRGQAVRIRTDIKQGMDCIYVKDVASAFYLAAIKENLRHYVFNIGSGVNISMQEAADKIKSLFPQADLVIEQEQGDYNGYPVKGLLDVSRAKEELGFAARDFGEGLVDYVKSIS